METSPEEILKRLEELRSWQGIQQQKLLSKQLTSSQLCSLEQQKLCEMFGLSSLTSTVSNLSFYDVTDQRLETPTPNDMAIITRRNTSAPENQLKDQCDMDSSSNFVGSPQKCFRVETPINNFSLEELESYGKETDDQLHPDIGEEKPKKKYLKRGQGLAARFKIHPEKLRIENLPKYKFANSHKKSKFFRDYKQHCDGQQQRLDVVTKSKQLVGDSKRSTLVKQEVVAVPKQQNKFIADSKPSRASKIDCDQQSVVNKKPQPSATWAKVLQSEQEIVAPQSSVPSVSDPNIFNTPTMAEKTQKQRQDRRDLQIFELLEQNLNNSASLQSSDIMKQLIQYMLTNPNGSLQQCNAQQELHFDQSSCGATDDGKRNVRFAMDQPNDRAIENDESECETMASTDIEEMDHSKTSTPLTKTPFELFKQKLFVESDSTLIDKYCKDNSMKLRNEELKERLTELQNEIELFRQQNAMLTKSMQEHEVEKLLWEEQKNEMMEKIEDERIRQEVYLHDERMKLVDEQKKFDKRAKELRAPNRKDKEDMAKLKQENADLQKELAGKDQKHISAQARLRAQIRNMEKDLKEFSMEIDNLRKENKKIEAENVRLRRQNNNKMLNEINKNIAKLTPKLDTDTVVDRSKSNSNKNSKSTVEAQSLVDNKSTENRLKSVQVKEVPKTYESDDSDSDVSTSSSTTPKRSTYFKDSQGVKVTNEKISTPSDDIPTLESNASLNLKREIVNSDGSRDIWYPNGNLKKVSADEMVIRMLYFNKDVKETNIHEGTVKYYYAEANTWQTTYLDGLEIWEFPNGRNEHHYKDGRIEAHHPDGSICTTNPNDMETAEEWKYLNGTTFVIKRNGDKYLSLPNGQREVTTKNHVRREYPDGTVKIKYPDGSLETRYSNGRIRLRDAAGTLVRDTETQSK